MELTVIAEIYGQKLGLKLFSSKNWVLVAVAVAVKKSYVYQLNCTPTQIKTRWICSILVKCSSNTTILQRWD